MALLYINIYLTQNKVKFKKRKAFLILDLRKAQRMIRRLFHKIRYKLS